MMLSFGEAVRRFYGNYANAEGRAQRSAYWWVVLYQIIIYAVLIIVVFMAEGGDQLLDMIGQFFNGNMDPELGSDFRLGASGIMALILMVIFALVNFLPDIMLRIRRFHDLGQSGWLVLLFMGLGAIPTVGFIADLALFVWYMFPGTKGSNKYGQDPLAPSSDIFG